MKRICCILLLIIVFAGVESKAQVNKGDSLALVDLYNSTNGVQWTNNSGWLQGPVSSWVGLRLQGNR